MRVFSIKYHRMLGLIAGIALLIWGISGLLHPIMTTWGPQQAVFFPPKQAINLQGVHPLSETLATAGIEKASAVRVVPSDGKNVLQVTIEANQPRQYFELVNGTELINYDVKHAEYLARYYTKAEEDIRSVEWLDEFTPEYPWVNRLLPVYKVSFDRPDNLSIFVYTETNASAGLSNNFKHTVQTGFRWLHTWSWFPRDADWARVVLISLFMLSLFSIAVTGIGMLLLIKRKARAPGGRGWHRLAGYVLALPILSYSASGLFHLLTFAAVPPVSNLQLSEPIDLNKAHFPIHEQWEEISAGLNVSTVSIIEDVNGNLLYRLGIAKPRGGGPNTAAEIRNARYDGVERTGPAIYLDASTGLPVEQGDKELALQLSEKFTQNDRELIEDAGIVTRFGSGYDFRNKRLPVWRFDYGAPVNATVFVDTTTGVLADVTLHSAKPEQWSFSQLHKFDFLRMAGRDGQNVIIAIIVLLCLGFLAALGLQMDIKRRRR